MQVYGGGCREVHAGGQSQQAEEVVERARGGLLEGVEEVAHGGAAVGEAAREVRALDEGAHARAEELAALGVAVLLGDGVERAGDGEEGLRARQGLRSNVRTCVRTERLTRPASVRT